mmetsp:Transcript_81126/g.225735  ORF Transcript_81126/g.225735 Transcript_81126/m.225735 type:complete len:164 (-) Transcript_81126:279-770(-)
MAALGKPLDEFIDTKTLECLNVLAEHPVTNAFVDNASEVISDTDHQMIIKVEFRQPIKLSAIKISANGTDDSAPAEVNIFEGKPNLGFDDGEEDPVQTFNLSAEDVQGDAPQPVRFVKFQNVNSLQMFVKKNQGGENTRIRHIQFFGQPAQSMDMRDWKPVKG